MTARLRVFPDSNVLISALIDAPGSAPVILVDWLAGGLPVWQAFLAHSGIKVVPDTRGRTRGINAKDASIVAAAVRAGATHFVTGDKRLIAKMERNAMGSPLPVTPRQMLDLLLQSTGHDP